MKVTVRASGQECTTEFHSKILLWDALAQMGFVLDRPCGGRGVCGNCTVTANGEPVRACITYLEEDVVVEDLPLKEELQVVTGGEACKSDADSLVNTGYGMAIDIGTTTIAGYLYRFPEGELVKSEGTSNPQSIYGADIVSRMEYALTGGADKLQDCLKEQIRKLAGDYRIEKYVITGNTVMLHLLTGKDTKGMAFAPYQPESLFGQWYGNAYLPPCISAFVGADITCAILCSRMLQKKTALLVDIGTNGEMVLWHKGKLLCCSAAAGPAFEGAEISQGMLAQNGAISRVYLENGEVKYTTIGEGKPKGICGSGLIDAIAVMLELDALDDTGYLEETFEIGDSKVYVTQEDVRQVQLAKSAIRSGMDTLLHEAGISYEELEGLYVAGGFGSYIDKRTAAYIGLLPKDAIEKVSVIGNGAGMGAVMILQSEANRLLAEDIARKATTIQLADSMYFGEKYIENMMFENK